MNSRRRILTSGAQVEPIIAPVHSDAEIETVITSLAREPGGGLITVPDNFVNSHRQTVISLAARNKIPAVYQISVFVRDGGLLSYGADDMDAYRRAATVVERILRGEKPSDLPVQLPAKFEMAVNLKTAKPSASPRKRGLYRRQLGDEFWREPFGPLLPSVGGNIAPLSPSARVQAGSPAFPDVHDRS